MVWRAFRLRRNGIGSIHRRVQRPGGAPSRLTRAGQPMNQFMNLSSFAEELAAMLDPAATEAPLCR